MYVILHVTNQDSDDPEIVSSAFAQLLQVRSQRLRKVEQAPFVSLLLQYVSAPAEPGTCTPSLPVFMHGDAGGGGGIGGAGGIGGIGIVVRNPQSAQSFPKLHAAKVEPTPPSSHSPSDA